MYPDSNYARQISALKASHSWLQKCIRDEEVKQGAEVGLVSLIIVTILIAVHFNVKGF